ncbi:MAG: sigma-54-dependent transcriptional regulator [Candidatus Krumholzibacteriia bacterium]
MTGQRASVLIVDDERDVREPLGMYLRREGFAVFTAAHGGEALDVLSAHPVRVVLSDVRMPVMDGTELLHRVRAEYPDTHVIMFTAFGTGDDAAAAIRSGAKDYILKPVVFEDICQKILRVCEVDDGPVTGRGEPAGQRFLEAIQGESDCVREMKSLITRVAEAGSSALITGESGTGKELVAKALHHLSDRRDGTFLAVNCAAIPEQLLESEFFGHAKGSFTGAYADKKGLFESAGRGTLFLDEVSELPHHMQAKLLRALEEKEVTPIGKTVPIPVRAVVLAACSMDLKREVDEGRFRMDLFYRLNVIEMPVPPLRDRDGDVELLARYFLDETRKRLRTGVRSFSSGTIRALGRYDWPGNIRELRNVIERAVVLARGETIEPLNLPDYIERFAHGGHAPRTMKDAVKVFERELILKTLRECGNNKRLAAKKLGMGLSSLYRKLEELDLS